MALNHYSHYRNSEAATLMYEVVSPALFEVYLSFPNLIKGNGMNSDLLFEHVRSISGLDGLTPAVGNVVQKYKFAERHYAAAGPDKTSLELTITFTMNLNNHHENYVYNMLRKWYDLIYNPKNGEQLTKLEYAGGSAMDIYEYDRNGSIWRHVKCYDFFPSTPPTGLNDDNYDSVAEAKTLSMTFIVDQWDDYRIDNIDTTNKGGFTGTNIYKDENKNNTSTNKTSSSSNSSSNNNVFWDKNGPV
jgi:hypothetical protein